MTKESSHQVNDMTEASDEQQKKLVLCFDGTSNQFQGDESDTNVVKLYQMLDRSDKHQYHYYQPGIGTYRANSQLQNTPSTGFFAKVYSQIRAKVDEAFADTFVDHVMAGYKFLMRYYMEGDKIYIFGFSRGAYTARFLCELINGVGLLSKGNEEMVPFIWYQYIALQAHSDDEACKHKIQQMRETFCRYPIEVFWLGLWDCVNSVAQLSATGMSRTNPSINDADPNIARHVRHAVSCHERRVKFKPTLFIKAANRIGTFQEMWFAGNHGDIGGGWQPNQDVLLSDFALLWMVEEIVNEEELDPLPLSWRREDDPPGKPSHHSPETTYNVRKQKLMANMSRLQNGVISRPDMLWHDVLNAERSVPSFKTYIMLPFWWLMECLPLQHVVLVLKRGGAKGKGIEEEYSWRNTSMPNFGHNRNIPLRAKFHSSVQKLHDLGVIKSMAMWQFGPEGYMRSDPGKTTSSTQTSPSFVNGGGEDADQSSMFIH